MNRYAVRLTPDKIDGGFVVTFPDFPEAVTQGETAEDALEQAIDCLSEAIAARMVAREPLPAPKGKGTHWVEPSLDLSAKAAIYSLMQDQQLSVTSLARRLEVGETEARRLIDPHHQTRLSRLDKVARKLGKRLRIELVDTAPWVPAQRNKC
jgi:antitoxin HicB